MRTENETETCPDCGTVHSIYDEHEANNCIPVLRTRLAAANERAERAEREQSIAYDQLDDVNQRWKDAAHDLTAAHALLRECLEGREDCDDLTCSATKLCEFCDLTARIEAHLEGK